MTRFPLINHLDDVKKYIDPAYFLLCQKEGYQVIDYFLSAPNTFPSFKTEFDFHWEDEQDRQACLMEMAYDNFEAGCKREFRGIIFDMEGKLIRRPWHKFFNLNEKQETLIENIDVSQPHMILEKLDGSMIAPFMLNGKVVWGTKMGLTDVAKPVQEFVNRHPEYEDFAFSMINNLNATPIFEWCSRQQRIVLDYPQESLILTGMRSMNTGEYFPHNNFLFHGMQHKIPVVKAYEGSLNAEFLDYVKNSQDLEGFVIVFEDGNRMKVKCEWYCQLHQVKAAINQERNVVDLILNNKLDDLKSLLPKEDLERLDKYEHDFQIHLIHCAAKVQELIHEMRIMLYTRKDYALFNMKHHEQWENNIIFKTWDEPNVNLFTIGAMINEYILKHCNRNVKFDEMRKSTSLFKNVPEWRQLMFDNAETIV